MRTSFLPRVPVVLVPTLLVLGSLARAQGPSFQSPGMTSLGQLSRFSNETNPALSFVIDAFTDYIAADGAEDGVDLQLRLLELNGAAYVDPAVWAWIVLTTEGFESPEVEEAAAEYIGDYLPGNSSVRAGRFFVDFGKQMQTHLEGLRTLERPLPLREYLGEELSGTGIQYDNWFALDDATPVRFSVGVFGDLVTGGHHEEEEDGGAEVEGFVPERKDFDELSFTARLTGMTDVGESGILQLGASARFLPSFAFEGSDDATGFSGEASDLTNVIWGLDATYGHTDETGIKRFTAGVEALFYDGEIAAEIVPDGGGGQVLEVVDDTALGFYAFADYGWDRFNSAGIQYALAESVQDTSATEQELDFYYTHLFTELRRLRFGVTLGDSELEDVQFVRGYVQFTVFLGTHSHGLNW